MQFTPKSKEELEALLPAGEYDAEVVGAEDKQSKKDGSDMIELRLKVYGPDGEYTVTDFLTEKSMFRLRNFCEASGQMGRYNAGDLRAADCCNLRVTVTTKVEEAKGEFGPKARVKKYSAPKAYGTTAPGAAANNTDDVPF